MPNLENLVKFGWCPVCGNTGKDEDGDRLTGYELKEYKGEYMCTLCIIRLQDLEFDEGAIERQIGYEQFRDAIGMKFTPK